MTMTINQYEQPIERRRDLWNWCFRNGFLATEIADPIVVDPDRHLVTIQRFLPVSQPGDPDFPELRRDEFNRPLTQTETLALVEPVRGWMVTRTGEQLAA